MSDPNIIEKIQKVRAITERHGATEDEATAAEQRMFALLAKYNLELSEIPDTEAAKPDTTIESHYEQYESSVWKRSLYQAVARLNFSDCFWTSGEHIIIVGTRANIVATREMGAYLIETVNRLANEARTDVPPDERRRYHHSFVEGCAFRICDRLEEMRLEAQAGRMKAEDTNSLLPALADLYQTSKARVDDFIAKEFGKIYKRNHYFGGGHNGGYVAGYNAGDKVGLHRQVSSKHKRLIG